MKRVSLIFAMSILCWQLSCSDETTANNDAGPPPCPKDFPFSFEGACLAKEPTKESQRTQCGEIVEDCDKTAKTIPTLDCFTKPAPQPPAGPAKVTLTGFIDVFSSGPDADGIIVQVYDAATLESAIAADKKAGKLVKKYFPSSVTPLGKDLVELKWTDTTKLPTDPARGAARACPKDNKLKLPCIVPKLECGPTKQKCDLKGDEYCHNDKCIDRLRWETRYKIDTQVPTNKYLVIRTLGKDGNGFDDGTWGLMAQFNVYLEADAPKCAADQYNDCINAKGEYEMEVNALSKADYATIPITAGLSGGVPEGHGGIAGEVHDCDDIKLSNFHVGTKPTPTVLTYFNGNPVKTLPDLSRSDGTNNDGLFAALDIVPGPVKVSAAGYVNKVTVTAGSLDVAVLPDTVTVITFEGRKPAP